MTDFLQNEQVYLRQYKLRVEEKLNWSDSSEWRHHDFEALSQKIFEETEMLELKSIQIIYNMSDCRKLIKNIQELCLDI